MKRFAGKLGIAVALLASMAMVGQTAAYGAGTAVVTGQGTITPGVSATPTAQSFTFTTLVAVGAATTGQAGQISCSFTGTSGGPEDAITGGGGGSGTCGGALGPISCTIDYARVGVVVTVSGTCTTGAGTALDGAFIFIPTSAPTVSSYLLAGGAVIR